MDNNQDDPSKHLPKDHTPKPPPASTATGGQQRPPPQRQGPPPPPPPPPPQSAEQPEDTMGTTISHFTGGHGFADNIYSTASTGGIASTQMGSHMAHDRGNLNNPFNSGLDPFQQVYATTGMQSMVPPQSQFPPGGSFVAGGISSTPRQGGEITLQDLESIFQKYSTNPRGSSYRSRSRSTTPDHRHRRRYSRSPSRHRGHSPSPHRSRSPRQHRSRRSPSPSPRRSRSRSPLNPSHSHRRSADRRSSESRAHDISDYTDEDSVEADEEVEEAAPVSGYSLSALDRSVANYHQIIAPKPDKTCKNIHESLVPVVTAMFYKPLSAQQTKELLKESERPENVDCLRTVLINEEVFLRLDKNIKEKDQKLRYIHNVVTASARPMTSLWDTIVQAEAQIRTNQNIPDEAQAVLDIGSGHRIDFTQMKNQADASLRLTGAAHSQTLIKRRNDFRPSVKPEFRSLCNQSQPYTYLMFGESLKDNVSDIANLNKIANQTSNKKSKKHQRFLDQSRGGRDYNKSRRGGQSRKRKSGGRNQRGSQRDTCQSHSRSNQGYLNRDQNHRSAPQQQNQSR